jgi:transcriptional regulator, AraC family
MVCNRCIMVVRSELEKAGFNPLHVGLGEVELEGELSDAEKVSLNERLAVLGFSLIDDKRSRIIEKIKNLITELVYQKNNELRSNLSDYLSDALRADYSSLSNLFCSDREYHHRTLLHRPENRTGEGVACVRRAVTQRNCRYVAL